MAFQATIYLFCKNTTFYLKVQNAKKWGVKVNNLLNGNHRVLMR